MNDFEIFTLAEVAAKNGLTAEEAVFLPCLVDRVIEAAPSINTTLAAVNEISRNAELAAYLCDLCRTGAVKLAGEA